MKRVFKKCKDKGLIKAGLVTLSFICVYSAKGLLATAATLPISVRIVRAVEMTVTNSLNFGTLAVTLDGAGQATIDPDQNRLKVDGGGSLSIAGGNPNVGILSIKGVTHPVTISIEDTSVQLTNGQGQITVQGFNMLTSNGGHRVTITPQAGQNTVTIPVGATLSTNPGQLTGTYTGTTKIYASFQ